MGLKVKLVMRRAKAWRMGARMGAATTWRGGSTLIMTTLFRWD